MKKPTKKELEELKNTFGFSDQELCDAEDITLDSVDENGGNLGYFWVVRLGVWLNKNNSLYSKRQEEILEYLYEGGE